MKHVPLETKQEIAKIQAETIMLQLILLEREISKCSRANNYTIDYSKCKSDSEYTDIPFGSLLCLDEFVITFFVELGCRDIVNKTFVNNGFLRTGRILKEDHMYELEPIVRYNLMGDNDNPLIYFNVVGEYGIDTNIPDKYNKRKFRLHFGENIWFPDAVDISGINICELIENMKTITEGIICYYNTILCGGSTIYDTKYDALSSSVSGGVFFDRLSSLFTRTSPIGAIYGENPDDIIPLFCNIPVVSRVNRYVDNNPHPTKRGQRDHTYKLSWYMARPNITKGQSFP